MGNDTSNFIPEVWSKKLSLLLKNSGVMKGCVNTAYEGEIKGYGDTVHIRSIGTVPVKDYDGKIIYSNLESPMQDLVIDQKKYFAFKVADIEKAQADINIMEEYLSEAKTGVELVKDSFLLSKHVDVHADRTVGLEGTPIALTKDNAYATFIALAKTLKKSNAMTAGVNPWCVINPDIEAILLNAPEFIKATAIGDKTVREGTIGRIAGLDLLMSTNLEKVGGKLYMMAGTDKAISVASQIVEIEKIRLQDSFDTAVRALYVYGAKVIHSQSLAKAILTY